MLVEIPEPEIILGIVVAFFIGILVLYTIYKIKPSIKRRENFDVSSYDRLEFYERQLIDMKIRLDAMEMQGFEQKNEDPNIELKQFLEKLAKNQQISEKSVKPLEKMEVVGEKSISVHRMPNFDHNNATDYVLRLITDKAMTSRDIQITLKRSREHTSRLMKKLFEDGYVQRNINTKPYTYSITKKGKEKIESIQSNSIIA